MRLRDDRLSSADHLPEASLIIHRTVAPLAQWISRKIYFEKVGMNSTETVVAQKHIYKLTCTIRQSYVIAGSPTNYFPF